MLVPYLGCCPRLVCDALSGLFPGRNNLVYYFLEIQKSYKAGSDLNMDGQDAQDGFQPRIHLYNGGRASPRAVIVDGPSRLILRPFARLSPFLPSSPPAHFAAHISGAQTLIDRLWNYKERAHKGKYLAAVTIECV